MLDEQRNAFRQVIEYIRAEKPNAVVIAGDIYDRAVPNVEAVRVFDDLLTDLAHEGVDVLLIVGNHDSPERLNYASRLLTEMKLHICGTFNGAAKVVALTDEFGKVNFFLLPFVKPLTVRGYFADKEIESYGDALKAVLENADIKSDERNILVSHQFYTKAGVSAERSDSEINIIGGIDEIDAEILSPFDYVALGHLHGSQRVGAEHIRYAGSPIKYSFSECKQNKCVLLVEIKAKGNVTVKSLPLTPLHDLREIKGTLDDLLTADDAVVGNKEDYLRIILTNEDEIIDPMNKLRSVYPNAMVLDFDNSHTSIDLSTINTDAEKVEQLSEYDLFCQFFTDVTGGTMTAEQVEIIRNLLDEEDAQ
jgi:exonuclease SbcD